MRPRVSALLIGVATRRVGTAAGPPWLGRVDPAFAGVRYRAPAASRIATISR
jgi:hypothetical protein